MKKIVIADATLRSGCALADAELGFKEKIEIVRLLDRLHIDVIETPLLVSGKSDVLFLHAVIPLFKGVISCPAGLSEPAVRAAYEAVKGAKHPRLLLLAPVSTVQMEYLVHQKPPAVLESIGNLTKLAKSFGVEVEVSLLDATRAERDFLVQAAETAIANGADIINIGDSAGTLFPSELAEFLQSLMDAVPKLKDGMLSVECSDALHMASACAVACMKLGIGQLKTAVGVPDMLPVSALADVLKVKGSMLGMTTGLHTTVLHKISEEIGGIFSGRQTAVSSAAPADAVERGGAFELACGDDMEAVAGAVRKLGYELSAEDLGKVCEEVRRITCKKKEISSRDLDAIVATVAQQAPPVYRLKSFVITCGNMMTAMAHVVLEKNGEEVQGFSMGDGPIDAAFISIENIVGRHFELDDFRISAVTEGREAVGSSVVRLRSSGKLYSGKGVSTDIIGAGIRAYLNALNKICCEEEEKE